jgi:hypothetical protein
MATIHEAARETPIAHQCDLCVIGGSTTGVFAAVAAARLGARVALVEAQGYLGGTATAGLVCVWHSKMNTTFQRQIVGGLPLELMDRLKARDAVRDTADSASMGFVFSPFEMALELDVMLQEAGVRPFLHARFVAPALDDAGRVTAAIIEDKSGRRAIKARYYVDATGDADLVHRMGHPIYTRDRVQPPTTAFLVQGLAAVAEANPGFDLRRHAFDPVYPEALRPGFMWWADLPVGEDLRMIAGTRVHGANCADADELTRAEIEGRRQVRAIMDILHRHVPGGDAAHLVGLPAHIGLRESRHACCLHTLTEEEVLHGAPFADAIANGSYRVDVHAAQGDGLVFRYLDGTEVTVYANGDREEARWRPPQEEDPTYYQIPYASLVPRDAHNVIVAGRCLDADEGAFGATRVMINCAQMGHAAGVASFAALDDEVAYSEVDVQRVRDILADQGAVVL